MNCPACNELFCLARFIELCGMKYGKLSSYTVSCKKRRYMKCVSIEGDSTV